ncbi:LuxR C-terminal-related transcriptional regulator [Nocardioides sp. AN3]
MIADVMRPDDHELVRLASRNLRRHAGIPVVFGGLREANQIRVTAATGAQTDALRTIVVQPRRGLGGRCWTAGRAQTVPDYATAHEITHDFDEQILGERIARLSVAPITVRGRIAGLLYGGFRSGTEVDSDHLRSLQRAAARIAHELHVRDLVDERVRILASRSEAAGGYGAGYGEGFDLRYGAEPGERYGEPRAEVRAQLAALADSTSDPDTARALRALIGESVQPRAATCLTPRQTEVVRLVAAGLSNLQIAEHLGLSELSVKSYLRAAMGRLGVRNRVQAALEARRLGIVD